MSLASWYSSLFEPISEFAAGAGVPSPPSAAAALTLGSSALMGDPGARAAVAQLGKQAVQGTARAITRPLQTAGAALRTARERPAYAAGALFGMAVPMGPRNRLIKNPNPLAMEFGKRSLRAAELRVARADMRVEAERAAMHAELEGPTGPLPEKPFTAEEHGEQILRKQFTPPSAPPMAWGIRSTARDLEREFPDLASAPKSVAFYGERWISGPRGWTRVEGAPIRKQDVEWIFKKYFDQTPEPGIRESNIEGAVQALQEHAKYSYFGLTERRARAITGTKIYERMAEGTATTQEIAWWNLWKSGAFKPKGEGGGGMKWTR